jgi:hypothetical protein
MFKVKVDDEQFFFRNIHHDATVCFEPMFLENVESYEHVGFDSYEFIVAEPQRPKNENEILPSSKSMYCIVDTESSGNFGHFFWESLINLRQLKRLNNKYPNIIFLVKTESEFKRKIFAHYGFTVSSKIDSAANYVAFFAPITSLINNKYTHYYSLLLDEFHFEINQKNRGYFEKDIEAVYFPRHQKIGNFEYEGQDRSFNTSEIQAFLSNRQNCLIYDSENSDSWSKEIDLVKRSKYIICHDGSSYSVMGSHAFNSVLIVLSNNVFVPSMRRFDKVTLIDKKISSNNQRYFVRAPGNNFTLNTIAPLLEGRIVSP